MKIIFLLKEKLQHGLPIALNTKNRIVLALSNHYMDKFVAFSMISLIIFFGLTATKKSMLLVLGAANLRIVWIISTLDLGPIWTNFAENKIPLVFH